ncbi:LysR family transcriptional regulator [Bordetella genomosp. 9]|uniref:LysR family transcriptional regulator n=1 Tax=Bordetella genomosp. 9 TaxID=1416803 RepID=A0A261RPF7_9BORD|nr:LysR family transcriptional regulator [Bordetella genomosp. 9]OZI26173.1 LysR family transcriptional regulator [Bordetella genomosp. 9]
MPHSPMALSHLKFRHLLLIESLIEQGTIHKAARQLNISQPAATAMLNDLEALVGFPLFVRSRQGVTPTAQTQALLGRVRTILNEFDELSAVIGRVAAGRSALLRVGVVPQAFIAYLPRAIDLFRQAGGCAIRTHESTARQLLDMLIAGELDCVIGRLPNASSALAQASSQLSFVNLYREEICIVVGPHNAAASRRDISYEDLARCEWVMQRPDSAVRGALAEAFLRHGVQPPEPVVETSTYIQNLAIVAQSNLFTVAPRRAAAMHQELGLVRILDVPLDVVPMQVCLIRRKASSRDPTLALFEEAFLESVRIGDESAHHATMLRKPHR